MKIQIYSRWTLASAAFLRTYECRCSRHCLIEGINGSMISGSRSLHRNRNMEPTCTTDTRGGSRPPLSVRGTLPPYGEGLWSLFRAHAVRDIRCAGSYRDVGVCVCVSSVDIRQTESDCSKTRHATSQRSPLASSASLFSDRTMYDMTEIAQRTALHSRSTHLRGRDIRDRVSTPIIALKSTRNFAQRADARHGRRVTSRARTRSSGSGRSAAHCRPA